MKTEILEVTGNWKRGLVLDKHSISSTFKGYNEAGRPQFDTIRTEVGEATFQLKYRDDWSKVQPLAKQIAESICPRMPNIGFIVPMPASVSRARQPVTEIAKALGEILSVPMFDRVLLRRPIGASLKDIATKAEKVAAIGDSFYVQDGISNQGSWNVLLVDDLYHTGASAEAACSALASYSKVKSIYFAALTWR
jgi:predicted amidophosphoribosyltransferase